MRQTDQPPISDQALFEQFLNGDSAAAVVAIYARHAGQIERYCRGKLGNVEDARDATQETFMTLLKRKGGLRAVELVHYLRRTARFVVSEIHRKQRSSERLAIGLGAMTRELGTGEADAKLAAREGLIQSVLELIDGLKPEDRKVLHMRFLDGQSTKAIATALGASEGAVRARIRRALAKIVMPGHR